MNTMNPMISVIIPCYNQGAFLKDALQTVKEQTYVNWECIIVNDGSTDETRKVAQAWEINDVRFKYVEKENGGLSSARNAGLNQASGAYIQFLDADDCIDPKKFEDSIKVLTDEAQDIVVTNFNLFESREKLLPPYCRLSQENLNINSVLYEWDNGFSIPIHCGIFKKTLFQNFRFPEHIKAKEDWIMWVSLFKEHPKVWFLDRYMAFYRINSNGMTRGSYINMRDELINAIVFMETILDKQQYQKLIISVITRYYDKFHRFNKELVAIKSHFVYRIFKKLSKVFNLN